MYKCYFCNNLHDIINKDDCIIFLDRIITRFKNNNVQELMKEIEDIYINKKLNIIKISNKKDEKYLMVLLSPLKSEDNNDMFNVKIVKRVKVNDEIKNYSGKGVIKFYKSDGYNPTENSIKK